jgi:hypothetical protein
MGVVKALWKKIETKWKWIENNLERNPKDSPMKHWVYCNNFEITSKENGQNKIWKKNLKIH